MTKRAPRMTKRERKGTPHKPRPDASGDDRKALYSQAFATEREAVLTLVKWTRKSAGNGHQPAQLAAILNSLDPDKVTVTMGTRAFWRFAITKLGNPEGFEWIDDDAPVQRLEDVPIIYMTARDDYTVMQLWALAATNHIEWETK